MIKEAAEKVCKCVRELYDEHYGFKSAKADILRSAMKELQDEFVSSGCIPQDWRPKFGIGQGNLAQVMWVVFRPEGQELQDGIYVGACFGQQGNGFVVGCMKSASSKSRYGSVPTQIRYDRKQGSKKPEINIDGHRKETWFNNVFLTPLEVMADHIDENVLINHLKISVKKCQDTLASFNPAIVVHPNIGETSGDRYDIWGEFLDKWPSEKIGEMKLDEYTSFGAPYQAFCNWIELWTQSLGSIWGGSAYKFCVFRMNPDSKVVKDSTRDGDGKYKWYKCYGKTAQEAFDYVRNILVRIVNIVKDGTLTQLDDLKLGDAVKWKIAFLYQSMERPRIVPIYSRKMLSRLTLLPESTPISKMQETLMSKKPVDQDLFDYYDELLEQLSPEDDDAGDKTEEPLSTDIQTVSVLRMPSAVCEFDG